MAKFYENIDYNNEQLLILLPSSEFRYFLLSFKSAASGRTQLEKKLRDRFVTYIAGRVTDEFVKKSPIMQPNLFCQN
jgi:hypothetical protein